LANTINLATGGVPGFSVHHVGIVCDGLVYESVHCGRPACEVQRRVVRGVQAHKLETIVGNSGYARLWEYPLRRQLYADERLRLRQFVDSQLGKDYDVNGAWHSGGKLYAAVSSLWRGENVNTYFCSEFVLASLVEIGVVQDRNVSRYSPNHLLRYLRRKGICREPLQLK
jgi:hypothetical protein